MAGKEEIIHPSTARYYSMRAYVLDSQASQSAHTSLRLRCVYELYISFYPLQLYCIASWVSCCR